MELFASMHAFMQKQFLKIYITKSLHMTKWSKPKNFGTFYKFHPSPCNKQVLFTIKYGTCNSKNMIVGFCKGGDDHC